MQREQSRAAYDLAREHVERLRQRQGEGFGERLVAGLTRAERRAINRAEHERAQFERAVSLPPTLRQRQLLWCLGYRGLVPQNQAEVSALVAMLRDEADVQALRVLVRHFLHFPGP